MSANLIWEAAETLPVEKMRELQLTRLKECVKRAMNVEFYRETFAERGITPDSIRSLEDIRQLPFTVKDDLRRNYPFGMLAVPKSELIRIHASSGTTGKPTFCGYTRSDLDTWANLCARFLVAGGLRREHIAQVSFGYGLFTGGFGLHYGIEKVGTAVIPVSSGNTARQVLMLRDAEADALICTPSYALNLAEALAEAGLKPGSLNLKMAFLGGEAWTESMRHAIEEALGINVYNNYGLSEVLGPGVSGECIYHSGMHIQEDHFFVECIDPDTGEELPDGEQGELVITALTREAMPIIRYRTRDLATLDRSLCPCGRTTMRMGRVYGRTDDMMIVRGVNVFPSQIEEALLKAGGTAPHYLIELTRPKSTDRAVVKIEIRPEDFSDRMTEMQALKQRIDREINAMTGLRFEIELLPPNTLERSLGKAKRVNDLRNLKD
jgi:phenylacetate-CoA ligase